MNRKSSQISGSGIRETRKPLLGDRFMAILGYGNMNPYNVWDYTRHLQVLGFSVDVLV